MIKSFWVIVNKDGSFKTHHRSYSMPALYRTKGIAAQYAYTGQTVMQAYLVPEIIKEALNNV